MGKRKKVDPDEKSILLVEYKTLEGNRLTVVPHREVVISEYGWFLVFRQTWPLIDFDRALGIQQFFLEKLVDTRKKDLMDAIAVFVSKQTGAFLKEEEFNVFLEPADILLLFEEYKELGMTEIPIVPYVKIPDRGPDEVSESLVYGLWIDDRKRKIYWTGGSSFYIDDKRNRKKLYLYVD